MQRTITRAKLLAMLPRTLEPEIVDSEGEARLRDAADDAESVGRFVDDLLELRRDLREVVVFGAGTARVPIELCKRVPTARVLAIEPSEALSRAAKENIAGSSSSDRIVIDKGDATPPSAKFDAALSNGVLRRAPDPAATLAEMWRATASGGALFVRDLARPRSDTEIRALVGKYVGAPASDDVHVIAAHEREQGLLSASLHAGLSLEEVRELAKGLGLEASTVTMTGDRHWTLAGVKP